MATALKKIEPEETAVAAPATETVAIMSLIQRMVTDPSVSIERVEQAFAFYERVQASEARKAFDAAMAAAKAEIPVIKKSRAVTYKSKDASVAATSYKHEDLGDIAAVVDSILARHKLSYRYRLSSDVGKPVTVTCIVAHAYGHYEETTLQAGRDDTGGKNAIQAIGSSVTYLQRYTLKAALGLAAARDDDAATAEAAPSDLATISPEQIETLNTLLNRTGSNRAAFLKMADAENVADILAKDFEGLKKMLTMKARNGASP